MSDECQWPQETHNNSCINWEHEEEKKNQSSMKKFNSGATRTSEPLEDPEGFLSPAVIIEFNRYMAHHRTQADGEVRRADNWQRGMSKARYMRSMWRHFLDVWNYWRIPRVGDAILDSLCALMFNVHGMMLEVLISTGKIKRPIVRSSDVPKQQ